MSYQGTPPGPVPPGWYADPGGAPWQRYFDGVAWTAHTRGAVAPAPAPFYGPTGYAYPVVAAPAPTNGQATAAMVLGIVSVVIEWGGLLTLAAAVLAFIFGCIGISRANQLGGLHKGQAIAGIILGILGFLAYIFWGLLTIGILWVI